VARGGPIASDFDLGKAYGPTEADGPLTPASVLIALVERDHGLSVILTRRADTLRRHTGQIALPGGRRDPGETPWQTALREAHEEIGLEPEYVSVVGALHALPDGHRLSDHPGGGVRAAGVSRSPPIRTRSPTSSRRPSAF